MSDLALSLIRKAKEENATYLDLGRCGLTELPSELFDLTNIETLILSNEWVDWQTRELSQSQNSGESNRLSALPKEISRLRALKTLIAAGEWTNNWEIGDLTPLKGLTALTRLDFSFNKVSDLAPLKGLTALTRLYLVVNKVSDLTPLKDLTALTLLSFTDNLVSDLTPLKGLTAMTLLFFGSNKVRNLTPLKDLTALTRLYLIANKVSDLTPLKELTVLTQLNFNGNKVWDLTSMKKLTVLTHLYFKNNKVNDLTPLKELTALTDLDFSNDLFTDDFSNNQVRDLTPLLSLIRRGTPVRWKHLRDTTPEYTDNEQIVVGGNPLASPPPGIVQQGNDAILRYFAEIERRGGEKLLEARLLIVGQGGAGKTSLRRKLKDPNAAMPAQEESTRGIDVDLLPMQTPSGEKFKLWVWDFGGQNIQHYAHQFFLSGSALYALVHNQREQNTNFQYWLNIIEMLGGSSPVLIVQNEVAGNCEPIQNAPAIRERFPNVVSPFHQLDINNSANDERYGTLKAAIAFHASNPQLLPHFGKEYPISFVNVRKELWELAKEQYYVEWKTFLALCSKEGVSDPALINDFSATLTILGTCLHRPDDIELKNYVFLRPKWIIDAFFDMLYHEKVISQQGEFSEHDTLSIWTKPEFEGMHGKLIRLMESFDLCFRIKESKRYVLPQRRLPAGEEYPWNEPNANRVLYKYRFLPMGIVTRLTCRLHDKIEESQVWSDAVIFSHANKARAFVRERYSENEIWIDAAGEKASDLLTRIVDELDDIHRTSNYSNLKVETLVPCRCEVCIREKEPYYFDYKYLCQLVDGGETRERCKNSKRMVDIQQFLAKTGIKRMKKLKVFLSYSHKDEAMKDELDNHLSALKLAEKIETWNDRKILPGEEWDDNIKRELKEADIILLLVSSDFNSSKYIWEIEVKHAIERHKKGEAKVIPIMLRSVDYENLPYAGLQGLPKDMKPVTSYKNPDEAYLEIAKGVRALVNEMSRR